MSGNVEARDTQPFQAAAAVRYRCTCGADCSCAWETGGVCAQCGRAISADLLRNDLSATLSIPRSAESRAPSAAVAAEHPIGPTAPCDPTEPCGGQLGHFEIVDLLGQGGMAQVYRALDRSLQRFVAVKVLKPQRDQATAQSHVDRLLQEAIAQARVNHPNIVAIYYVGNQDGKRFLAMELVNGIPLSQRLADSGPLAFHEVVSIGLQIASALQASARLELIHGDIKPSNILWQENGVAKLSDFGLARSTSSPSTTAWGGTPNYLAPELLEGQAPSVQSDMYSLGVTLFELSFGRLPKALSGSSVTDWATTHRQQSIQFPERWPDHLPIEWGSILQRLLAQNPQERYGGYESLIEDLTAIMPVSQRPARLLPRLFAFGIDFFIAKPLIDLSILIVILVLGQARALLQFTEPMALRLWRPDMPWYMDMLNLLLTVVAVAACAVVPVAYLAWVGYWAQTPGRSLMHLRVVNRHGLRPKPRRIAAREAVRLAMALASVPIAAGALCGIPVVPLVVTVTILALLITIADAWSLVSSRQGQSLHDRWFQTEVVLDTR